MANGQKIKAIVSKEKSFSQDQVSEMVENGVIREEYLRIDEEFDGVYELTRVTSREVTSWKTSKKIDMEIWNLQNADSAKSVWLSTMMNAFVLTEDEIKADKIKAANGLPVYYKDDFDQAHPGLKTMSAFRNEDGGINIYNKYHIIGAVVHKSQVDETRWSVSYKMYEQGGNFLKLAKQQAGDDTLRYITEARLHELSKGSTKERTLLGKDGTKIVLPSNSQLRILYDADENIRWASATFILRKIW